MFCKILRKHDWRQLDWLSLFKVMEVLVNLLFVQQVLLMQSIQRLSVMTCEVLVIVYNSRCVFMRHRYVFCLECLLLLWGTTPIDAKSIDKYVILLSSLFLCDLLAQTLAYLRLYLVDDVLHIVGFQVLVNFILYRHFIINYWQVLESWWIIDRGFSEISFSQGFPKIIVSDVIYGLTGIYPACIASCALGAWWNWYVDIQV